MKSSNEHMVPIEDLVNPRALDYHAETGNIYFADTTSFLIGRQKVDGSSRETILKDGNYCDHLALILFQHTNGVFMLENLQHFLTQRPCLYMELLEFM